MIRSIEFRAMNTTVMLAAEGGLAIEGMQATKSFIDDCEQRFSRFLPASEVTELNQWAGRWHKVSDELFEMLQLSVKYHQETGGIFDPAILKDLKRAGYDRSMDEIRSTGLVAGGPASVPSWRPVFLSIELDRASRQVRLPHGMEIDLGGIAKGWIVKQAANLLHTYCAVCGVSAGGDILFIGRPGDGMDWDVYLEDPREPSQMLAQLHIPSGAVASSSVMKRIWRQGDQARHHLIDPRSGKSAETEWSSVTVICPDVIAADIYAKTILIGGQNAAADLIQKYPDLVFIAVDSRGKLVGSQGFREFVYETASNIFLSTDASG